MDFIRNNKKLIDLYINSIDLGDTDKSSQLESPIESRVYDLLKKCKDKEVEIIPQESIETENGTFRPDLILQSQDKRIAIECDGKEFHKDSFYDEWRDILILTSSNISAIYRFKGKDIEHNIYSLIFHISQQEPLFFDEESISRYNSCVTPKVRNSKPDLVLGNDSYFENEFLPEEMLDRDIKDYIIITKRSINKDTSKEWLKLYLVARLNPGMKIDKLKVKYKEYRSVSFSETLSEYYKKYPEERKQ